MSIPQRPWMAPGRDPAGGMGRGFIFPDHVARDPDELILREHAQEVLAPVLDRLRRGDMSAALRAAERLCRQRPGLALPVVELARLLLAEGAPEKALPLLEQVLRRNGQHAEALKLSAFAHMQQGDLPRACVLFGQAVRRAPADSCAQINYHALRRRLRPGREGGPTGQTGQTGPAGPVGAVGLAGAPRPVVATSIPPKGVETSRMAVDSWLQRGLRVLSVNTAQERDQLAPLFPGVEFRLCEDTARAEYGRDYQYLDALLDALAETGEPLCGIINADIVLRGEPQDWDRLCGVAAKRLVYGSRINVRRAEDTLGTLLEPGFDFYLFPASFLERVPRTGFVIGQPAWDVFLPAWAARCGVPRSFCHSPVALHVEHPVQWNRTTNTRLLLMAVSWLAPELAGLVTGDGGCHGYLKPLTSALAQVLNRAPKAGAEPLFCPSSVMEGYMAPVDPLYWLRDTEETLVVFDRG